MYSKCSYALSRSYLFVPQNITAAFSFAQKLEIHTVESAELFCLSSYSIPYSFTTSLFSTLFYYGSSLDKIFDAKRLGF